MIPRRLLLLLDDYETGAAVLAAPVTPFYGYYPPAVSIAKDNRSFVIKDNRTELTKDNRSNLG